jgi:WD40 repeat protein
LNSSGFGGQGLPDTVTKPPSVLCAGYIPKQLIRRAERDSSRTHSGGVNAVYFTRDGSRALTVSKDCTARLWDVTSGETTLVLSGHSDGVIAAAFSPDEELIATASYDSTVCLWSSATGECIVKLQHAAAVRRL